MSLKDNNGEPQQQEQKKLKEGLHYYIENGYRVFTELYHRERGFCCRQGCRHCAFKSEPK